MAEPADTSPRPVACHRHSAITEHLWPALFSWDVISPSLSALCHYYGDAVGAPPESVLYSLLAIVPILTWGMRVAPKNKECMSEALFNFVLMTQPSAAARCVGLGVLCSAFMTRCP